MRSHAESALGHHSSIFKPWSGPPRTTKAELVRPHLQALFARCERASMW
jgi:hypothetical protein